MSIKKPSTKEEQLTTVRKIYAKRELLLNQRNYIDLLILAYENVILDMGKMRGG